jgi:predicted transcriptional regulator
LANSAGSFGWGPLGPLQYAVLVALWAQSPATVRDLHRHFRTTAYKTLVGTLDRLYKKGLVRRERPSRANAYSPTMSREELATAIVESILPPQDHT